MERIQNEGKHHHKADATFRVVPTPEENWQTRSNLKRT